MIPPLDRLFSAAGEVVAAAAWLHELVATDLAISLSDDDRRWTYSGIARRVLDQRGDNLCRHFLFPREVTVGRQILQFVGDSTYMGDSFRARMYLLDLDELAYSLIDGFEALAADSAVSNSHAGAGLRATCAGLVATLEGRVGSEAGAKAAATRAAARFASCPQSLAVFYDRAARNGLSRLELLDQLMRGG